ncbi:hypothetical protein MMC17_004647 [Xylographa soralifera]|nr:hypothetical protein [Xylographa soralifera]
MEISPLVQQARPSFQPKISQLYEELFVDEDDHSHSEGFWSEFFLLRPDKASLQRRLEAVSADDLLHFQYETQQLFLHAVRHIKSGTASADEVALETLTVFLAGVLSKRYTNPSSDIITVLAGLDEVDAVFSDFANAIETIIRTGRTKRVRKKAIEAALSLTSGAYQTSLVSYFTHRDLFPSLMKYVQDTDDDSQAFEPFLLLGLLVNYNKFEYRNPYRLRLEDFVNEATIQKIVSGLGVTLSQSRNKYAFVIEDVPEGWNLSSTLTYIGLGVLAPIKAISPAAPTAADDNKEKFAALFVPTHTPSHETNTNSSTSPGPEAAILLSTYDFALANKLFCYNLITHSAPSSSEIPFSAFLSLTSYILQHASRSTRASLYALLALTTLRILLEDVLLCKRLCQPTPLLAVRLCRQRPPFLPPTPHPRPPAAHILDLAADALTHNLRRRLDTDLYASSLALVHRLFCCLAQNRTPLAYHWPVLWQALLSLLRFLATYAADLAAQPGDIHALLTPLLRVLALALLSGSAFLPDAPAYDDLVYKLVENSATLDKLQSAYRLGEDSPVEVLRHVAAHYHGLLQTERGRGRVGKDLSPREVGRVIRGGYEGLVLPSGEGMGLESWEGYREGEERGWVKRAGRVAVEDVRAWVRGL